MIWVQPYSAPLHRPLPLNFLSSITRSSPSDVSFVNGLIIFIRIVLFLPLFLSSSFSRVCCFIDSTWFPLLSSIWSPTRPSQTGRPTALLLPTPLRRPWNIFGGPKVGALISPKVLPFILAFFFLAQSLKKSARRLVADAPATRLIARCTSPPAQPTSLLQAFLFSVFGATLPLLGILLRMNVIFLSRSAPVVSVLHTLNSGFACHC